MANAHVSDIRSGFDESANSDRLGAVLRGWFMRQMICSAPGATCHTIYCHCLLYRSPVGYWKCVQYQRCAWQQHPTGLFI